jgi:hypothetical protein
MTSVVRQDIQPFRINKAQVTYNAVPDSETRKSIMLCVQQPKYISTNF